MGIQELTDEEIIQGFFALAWVIISMVVGLTLIMKYKSLKRKELITVGLTWTFLTSAWWPAAFSFISFISIGYLWVEFEYFLIGNIFIPIALLSWVFSFTYIMWPNLKVKLLIVYAVISAIWEILLLYFLFTGQYAVVGQLVGKFNSDYEIFATVYLIFAILTAFITGEALAFKTMKLDDPKLKWRGRFLSIAFISFTIGAIIDATGILVDATAGIILVRLLLISSGIEFYLGFLLPERVAKLLIKES